jgi:bacteriocin biosynthesis cyclodehydratase domain-containing protein
MKERNKEFFLKFEDNIDFIPINSDELLIRNETGKIIKIKEENIVRIIDNLRFSISKNSPKKIDDLLKNIDRKFSKKKYRKIVEFLVNKSIISKEGSKRNSDDYIKKEKISKKKMKLIEPQFNYFEIFTRDPQNQLLLSNAQICIITAGRIGAVLILILSEIGIENLTIINKTDSVDATERELLKMLDDTNPDIFIKEMTLNEIMMFNTEKKREIFSKITLFIVSDERFDIKFFKKINAYLYPLNKKYMFIWLEKAYGNIGPVVVPGETGCFECFLNWKVSNTSNAEDYSLYIDYLEKKEKFKYYYLNSSLYIIGSIAVNEVIKEIIGFRLHDTLYGKIMRYDTLSSKMDIMSVWKIPNCPICGQKGPIGGLSDM